MYLLPDSIIVTSISKINKNLHESIDSLSRSFDFLSFKNTFNSRSIQIKFVIGLNYATDRDKLLFYINKIAIDSVILQFINNYLTNSGLTAQDNTEIIQLKKEIDYINKTKSQTSDSSAITEAAITEAAITEATMIIENILNEYKFYFKKVNKHYSMPEIPTSIFTHSIAAIDASMEKSLESYFLEIAFLEKDFLESRTLLKTYMINMIDKTDVNNEYIENNINRVFNIYSKKFHPDNDTSKKNSYKYIKYKTKYLELR